MANSVGDEQTDSEAFSKRYGDTVLRKDASARLRDISQDVNLTEVCIFIYIHVLIKSRLPVSLSSWYRSPNSYLHLAKRYLRTARMRQRHRNKLISFSILARCN